VTALLKKIDKFGPNVVGFHDIGILVGGLIDCMVTAR
jgi:hypothetical protein